MLRVTTGPRTDFWSRTFYGFTHDSGHFRNCSASGDFSAEATVAANYRSLYDQAGLMAMADQNNWLKCGIELTDGALHFSTVVTREGYSDWSQLLLPGGAGNEIDVRLTRHAEALRVQYRLPGQDWRLARLAMLAMEETVQAGMMCCTPQSEGLEVSFKGFRLLPAISRELHS